MASVDIYCNLTAEIFAEDVSNYFRLSNRFYDFSLMAFKAAEKVVCKVIIHYSREYCENSTNICVTVKQRSCCFEHANKQTLFTYHQGTLLLIER